MPNWTTNFKGFGWDFPNNRGGIYDGNGAEVIRINPASCSVSVLNCYTLAASGGLTATGDVTLGSGADLTFSGTTGQSQINVTDNLADALSIKINGGNDLIVLTSTNSAEAVAVTPVLFSIGGVGYQWPASGGCAGEQLQTTACDVLSWECAASRSEVKDVIGPSCRHQVYEEMIKLPIYDYFYKQPEKPGVSRCMVKMHTGPLAEDAPWVVKGEGIKGQFNPINAFGRLTLAVQELADKVTALEARLA